MADDTGNVANIGKSGGDASGIAVGTGGRGSGQKSGTATGVGLLGGGSGISANVGVGVGVGTGGDAALEGGDASDTTVIGSINVTG